MRQTKPNRNCARVFSSTSPSWPPSGPSCSFLANHLTHERLRYVFLATLHRVVDGSTVCLMGHERGQTLQLIQELACRALLLQQPRLCGYAQPCWLLSPGLTLSPSLGPGLAAGPL